MYRPEPRANQRRRFGPEMGQQDEGQFGSQRDLTPTGEQSTVQQQGGDSSQRRSRGNWSGYVVPYRYYGNGYAGVGYYSVMYQGSDDDAEDQQAVQGGQGRGQFDQNQVDYGQGQGAGAAWTGRWGGRGTSSGGGYAGRGPKGYRRSDDRLQEEISDRLMADDWVDASDIEVRVKNGEVTLNGTVDDRGAKRRAEDIAEQVMGVRDVMNQIRVDSSGEARQQSTSTSQSGSGSGRRVTRNGGRSTDEESAANGTSRSSSNR